MLGSGFWLLHKMFIGVGRCCFTNDRRGSGAYGRRTAISISLLSSDQIPTTAVDVNTWPLLVGRVGFGMSLLGCFSYLAPHFASLDRHQGEEWKRTGKKQSSCWAVVCYHLGPAPDYSSTALPATQYCRLSWLCFYLPSGIGPIQPYLTGTVAAGHDKFVQVSCVACFSRPPPRT